MCAVLHLGPVEGDCGRCAVLGVWQARSGEQVLVAARHTSTTTRT